MRAVPSASARARKGSRSRAPTPLERSPRRAASTSKYQCDAAGAGIEWLGTLSPMRYYDPLAVLTASEYDLAGAAILLGAAAALLLAAAAGFREVDLA